jgi:hypothetical protein
MRAARQRQSTGATLLVAALLVTTQAVTLILLFCWVEAMTRFVKAPRVTSDLNELDTYFPFSPQPLTSQVHVRVRRLQ